MTSTMANDVMMVPKTFDLWQRAAAFAAAAHRHAVRRDGETPYFSHPTRVALTIATLFECRDAEALAVALLHDTIEDTGTDFDDLFEQFGEEIARSVACLTKDMRLREDERERAYDEQLRCGPWRAQLVKLADVFDNFHDESNPAKRDRIRSKAARALAVAGDDPNLARAKAIVAAMINESLP